MNRNKNNNDDDEDVVRVFVQVKYTQHTTHYHYNDTTDRSENSQYNSMTNTSNLT